MISAKKNAPTINHANCILVICSLVRLAGHEVFYVSSCVKISHASSEPFANLGAKLTICHSLTFAELAERPFGECEFHGGLLFLRDMILWHK
jgi:hypothetical protein